MLDLRKPSLWCVLYAVDFPPRELSGVVKCESGPDPGS